MTTDRIAVQRNYRETMSRKSEAPRLRGTRVQHMEQNTVSRVDSNRLCVAQHPAVDGEQFVADLAAVLTASEMGLEFLQYEEDLPIVVSGSLARFDQYQSCLATV